MKAVNLYVPLLFILLTLLLFFIMYYKTYTCMPSFFLYFIHSFNNYYEATTICQGWALFNSIYQLTITTRGI